MIIAAIGMSFYQYLSISKNHIFKYFLISRYSHHNYTYDAKVDKKKSDTKRDTEKQTNHRRLHHSHDYEKGELIFKFM